MIGESGHPLFRPTWKFNLWGGLRNNTGKLEPVASSEPPAGCVYGLAEAGNRFDTMELYDLACGW